MKSNHQTETATHQSDKNWVGFFSDVGKTKYYVVTTEKVSNKGRLLFNLNNPANDGKNGWASNTSATEIYAFVGVDTSTAVVVHMKDGIYVRANAVGTKKP